MSRNFEQRARDIFSRSNGQLENAIKSMLATHSAKGLLGSGATAKNAIALYESHSSDALNHIMHEQAKLITHRGRDWNSASAQIEVALEEQISASLQLLGGAFKVAGIERKSGASREVERLLDEVAGRLRMQLSDFRDGWTAPVPENFSQRNPIFYAIILLALGALVGELFGVIGDKLVSPQGTAETPSLTSPANVEPPAPTPKM